ncbi:lipocalin family protein [bacterium]|nr:lipocalin family protein [bacterium]
MLGTITMSKENTKIQEPATVKFVDLEKYTGLWYEIAKIPNRFQKKCDYGTTAQYTLVEDGNIEVINRCCRSNGDQKQAKGVAKVVDTVTNSKLKVSFVSVLGRRLFWGDYWIIGLDDDYHFAIVGDPDRKYGWILCREPEMDSQNLEEAFAILKENGYDTRDFVMTEHK